MTGSAKECNVNIVRLFRLCSFSFRWIATTHLHFHGMKMDYHTSDSSIRSTFSCSSVENLHHTYTFATLCETLKWDKVKVNDKCFSKSRLLKETCAISERTKGLAHEAVMNGIVDWCSAVVKPTAAPTSPQGTSVPLVRRQKVNQNEQPLN